MGLNLGDIDPLVHQLKDGSAENASAAMRAISYLELDGDAWNGVAILAEARLRDETSPDVYRAAAHLPLVNVRSHLRAVASDPKHPSATAARSELVEVRDEPTLRLLRDELVLAGAWETLMEMTEEQLALVPLHVWRQRRHWTSLFFLVAAGKAGYYEPVMEAFGRARDGELPEELAGDPMYMAELVSAALPVSPEFMQLIDLEARAVPRMNNLVGTLVQGILGEQMF